MSKGRTVEADQSARTTPAPPDSCRRAARSGRSGSHDLVDQDRGHAAGELALQDQDLVQGGRPAKEVPHPDILARVRVLLDPPQCGGQVRHHLLRTDDEDCPVGTEDQRRDVVAGPPATTIRPSSVTAWALFSW